MIEKIHDRLCNWADQTCGGFGSASGSIFGAMIDNPPLAPAKTKRKKASDAYGSRDVIDTACGVETRSSRMARSGVEDSVLETEKAVSKLPSNLREVIGVFYFDGSMAATQRAKKLGLSPKTMYRRIDSAHVILEASLYELDLPRVFKVIHS